MGNWPVESIPDDDLLYYRVQKQVYSQTAAALGADLEIGEFPPNIFRYVEGDDSLSTDWSRYSTPEATKARAKRNPALNAIAQFTAGVVRSRGHQVVHSPECCNRAHTSIGGQELSVRVTLGRIAQWAPGFGLESIGLQEQ